MYPQRTINKKVIQERAAMELEVGEDEDELGVPEFDNDFNDDNFNLFVPLPGDQSVDNQMEADSIPDQLDDGVDRRLNEEDENNLRYHANGLLFESLVNRVVKRTAEFAMNLKGKFKVADKTANELAFNWCHHMVSVVDEFCGLSEHIHLSLDRVIKAASSTDRQRSLVRLPITYTNIQLPQAARPYIYISVLDSLREMFKQPKIAELIHQDYLSKFSWLLYLTTYISLYVF